MLSHVPLFRSTHATVCEIDSNTRQRQKNKRKKKKKKTLFSGILMKKDFLIYFKRSLIYE